jgi:hypothetical protein
MRYPLPLRWALWAQATLTLLAAAPTYPVSGIVQRDPREAQVSPVPLADALQTVRMTYNDEGLELQAARDARQGGRPPVIVYMGGFTSNYEDVLWLENDHRRGIGMTPIAKLGAALDAQATEFQLTEPRGGELAVVASTANGVDLDDRTKYCYWIQVDDELMKVLSVDAASGRVRVQRAFDRSPAAAHGAGAQVFGPVYLGNRARMTARASSAWPGGTSRIRYALNPGNADAQAYKARCVEQFMKSGYDGAWWDTFQPQPYNLCDALGRKVEYVWDFQRAKPYDFPSYVEVLKNYLHAVRAKVKADVGREPVLYGNSVSGTYARGSKALFNTAADPHLLDGYCFEDSYLDVTPLPGARPGDRRDSQPPMAKFERVTDELWLRNVSGQADAARAGVHALCMAGPAGYLAARLNAALADYDALLRYSYASYLLTVTPARSTSFGLPLLVKAGPKHPHATAEAWPDLLSWPIGDPVQENDVTKLKLANTGCYAREFTGGYVAVYPSRQGAAADIDVPAGMIDPGTKAPVTKIRLAPGDAVILLRAKR